MSDLSNEEFERLTADQQLEYLTAPPARKAQLEQAFRASWAEAAAAAEAEAPSAATSPREAGSGAISPSGALIGGWMMVMIGIGLMIWGVLYDPTVRVDVPGESLGYGITLPSVSRDVVNLGEVMKKLLLFTGGTSSVILGAVIIGFARLTDLIMARLPDRN